MDEWVRVDGDGSPRPTPADRRPSPSGGAQLAGAARPGTRRPAPAGPSLAPEVATDIRNSAVGATAQRKERLVDKMADAVAAYDRGRYREAARLGREVAQEAPSVPAVRELVGLAAYRNGQWTEARRQLEAYRDLTGTADHVPELMDSLRALGRPKRVAEMWQELRRQSPEADLLAEARMVAAGTLADRGDLHGAITLLNAGGAAKGLRNPSARHVRQWYALADLYDRAGDLPKAAELFVRVHQHDPEAYDVTARLAALGAGGRGPRRTRRSARPKPAPSE